MQENEQGRKHYWTVVCGEGWRKKREKKRGTRTERNRRNERILIRNLKNKIITLPDSKCQLREGTRWRERETQEEGKRKERKKREKKHPEGDRWGWSDGHTITAPSRRKEYNLSDAKKKHIASENISHLLLEGNRAARSER